MQKEKKIQKKKKIRVVMVVVIGRGVIGGGVGKGRGVRGLTSSDLHVVNPA